MSDFTRRVNSIIVKNLPTDYNESQLEELFSQFGRIVSSKVLPTNPNFDGGCGFVNYAEADSCTKAVETMNNFQIDRYTLRVSHSATRMNNNSIDRPQNGFRANDESKDENNDASSPANQNRFNGFRPASSRSSTSVTPSKQNGSPLITNESEQVANNTKPLWNSTNIEPPTNKNSFQNDTATNIREHSSFVTNKTYVVYLSNLEVPSIIFAATLDDYVNATLLITQMNKHEELTKIQANSYKTKLVVGQCCAALFNGDWYRARILELKENRVRVQYIDWGNTGWCDSILEIRPLPNEFYKDAVLCVQCVLDKIPSQEKLADEQTNAILEILILDTKLEMTVVRLENGVVYVQLGLGERNLNAEIRAIVSQSSPETITQNSSEEVISFDSRQPEVNPMEIHFVQLTTVDSESECFHVILMRDCLPTIMHVLKDWDNSKQPLTSSAKVNTLVCAQYDGDDLWYRAWIKSLTETGCRVYFVDFGNEEAVSIDRVSECPDSLRKIPWQSVQIKLANITLTNDERYTLLRDFETDRLEMKIRSKSQNLYSVELNNNGKSLTEYMLESRKKKEQVTPIVSQIIKEPVEQVSKSTATPSTENIPRVPKETVPPLSLPVQPISNGSNDSKTLPPINTTTIKSTTTSNAMVQPLSTHEQGSANIFNENLTTMITEQRRQNRLLEQAIAAINTTNALLTQLVQR